MGKETNYQQVLLHGYPLGPTKIDVENPLFVDRCHSGPMVFPHLVVRMFALGYRNSIVGRSMTILQASYRSVAGSVLDCPTSFWMPWHWTPRSPMRRSWRCGSSFTFLIFSNILVVPQNSFCRHLMANHFKFIQVPIVFLLKLQNEEAWMEAAFLALPYLVLVLVFLLQLLCRKTSRKRPRPTEVLYVSRQMELLCDLRRRF